MAKRVICISHATGAGGEAVGRLVAERLGLRYLDEQIITRAAAEGRVPPDVLLDAERRRSVIVRLLDGMREAGAGAGAVGIPPLPNFDESSRALIREAIHAVADEGDAVIVAHAASATLGPRPDVLRVLVTASPETRAGRAGGERAIRESDKGRAAYLKTFHDVREELPTHYDVVVNTDTISEAQAAELVAAAAAL